MHTMHLYNACVHVSWRPCVARCGALDEQETHLAFFVTSLFFLHISKRPGSNAEHANVLQQKRHSTLAFSSEGFVLSIVRRPPLTPCAAPAVLLLNYTLLYSILGLRTVGSGDRQGVLLPLLLYSNIHYCRLLYPSLLYTKVL